MYSTYGSVLIPSFVGWSYNQTLLFLRLYAFPPKGALGYEAGAARILHFFFLKNH